MRRCLPLLVVVSLIAATTVAYWPVRNNQFISLDDPDYVTANPQVLSGLTWGGVRWAFSHFYICNYHPLTLVSHMLDVELFGPSPGGHHFMSVGFHAANSALLFLLLWSMTRAAGRSAFVAAAFALHPLHVESAAWVAERKDVLSTFFWIGTTLLYVSYARRPTIWRYALVAVGFALGLLSKPMLVTFPFALLLLDYWPLKRTARFGWLMVEKLPLMALSAIASVITLLAQTGAMASTEQAPLLLRLKNVPVAYCRYLWKTIWPTNLSIHYDLPSDITTVRAALAGLLLIAVTAAVVRARRRSPFLLVGWLWFLGTLVPVIGIVQVGTQSMADRYTYIPLIGPFIMLAWGMGAAVARWSQRNPVPIAWPGNALAAAAFGLLIAWGTQTRAQLAHWENSVASCQQALRVEPDNPTVLKGMGWALLGQGRAAEAIPFLRHALEHMTSPKLFQSLADALAADGKRAEGLVVLEKGMARYPNDSALQVAAGIACAQQKDLPRAQAYFSAAVKSDETNTAARHNLARTLSMQGKHEEAMEQLRKLLAIEPDNVEAHFRLSLSLAAIGQRAQSQQELRETLRLKPDHAGAMNNLAWALATDPDPQLRNGVEAVKLAERVSQLPGGQNAGALDTLAAAYAEAGRFAEAAQTADRAADLAERDGPKEIAAPIRRRAQLYRQNQPFRDSSLPLEK